MKIEVFCLSRGFVNDPNTVNITHNVRGTWSPLIQRPPKESKYYCRSDGI